MGDRLRICIVGHTTGPIDEGMKKVAASLTAEMSRKHDVLVFNPTRLHDPRQWAAVRRFCPDIIHYVPGPSWASFPLARALSLVGRGVPVVMTAIHPKHLGPRWVRRTFRPSTILVQSGRVEALMADVGALVKFLPLGVDLEKFAPISSDGKTKLRKEHGIPVDARVVLHVGNLREGRNLRALLPLCAQGYEVIVVGSTSVGEDSSVRNALEEAGVHVWTHYIPNIQAVYQMADIYVFPVRSFENAIEFPLSVLEAMACNLPVASTRFGGVGRFLQEGRGLRWIDDDTTLVRIVEELQKAPVATRTVADGYSWPQIAVLLEEEYRAAIAARRRG